MIDPTTFNWTDDQRSGITLAGQVVYELHIGTFTLKGTWTAACERLRHLSEIGITLVEVMPINEFYGTFGWGYDGVFWFAPTHLYGRPDDFRAFVDAAHTLGIGVILDVVYNHFGPSGNYLGRFSGNRASPKRSTEWGDSIDYDGELATGMREMVVSNAAYWISEFRLDGLRLDATHSIHDESPRHILADLSIAAREAAAPRSIVIVAENERQDVRHLTSVDDGGFGLDGLWNDDFHHACKVAATGRAESYYGDYQGSPQELHFGSEMGIPLPRPVERAATAGAGDTGVASAGKSVGKLSRKPRPSRKLSKGVAFSCALLRQDDIEP